MSTPLQTAISHHRAGRLADAEAIYRQLLTSNPNDPEPLHLLGLIACQMNQLEPAEQLIQQAVTLAPHNAEYLLNLGEIQRRQNHLAAAIATLRRAVELAPTNPFSHYNLAVALAAQHAAGPQPALRDQAIASYEQAIALQPHFPEALNNVGLLYHAADRFDAAIASFRRAIPLRATYAEAHTNLGISLWANDQLPEAVAAFQQALVANPNFAPAHTNLGLAQRILGQRTESLASLRRAAELTPTSADAQRELSISLIENLLPEEATAAARRAVELAANSAQAHRALAIALAAHTPPKLTEAVAAYQNAIALNPDPAWHFELASLQGDPAARTAPDIYVRTLFDNYAPRFESHLVGELAYRAPQDILAAVLKCASPPPQKWDILDLGCGTGLVGAQFRPHARHLVGVDLSPNMIARARLRNIYDELITSHITPAMLARPNAFDLILAGDVFIYVGDLAPVFPAAAAALRPGGLLAFSLEHHDQATTNPQGFVLHHRQRFAHSLTYIRQLAPQSHLQEISITPTPLRKDIFPGWIVVLQKPSRS